MLLETDNSIKIFTYLKKSDYIYARDGIEIFHDLSVGLQKELKQKRIAVINNKKLKKLICKKYMPEKFKENHP